MASRRHALASIAKTVLLWIESKDHHWMMTSRDDRPIRRFYWVMEELWTTYWSCVNKTTCVAVADELKVWDGTYNRKQMNRLYRLVKRLSTNSAVWQVQPFLLSTTPQKCTFDRRRKDLSGRTARLTSQRSTDGQSQRKFENERCTATSRQKRTSQHLPWDLNARTILQHCMLAASIFADETEFNCFI